MIEIKLGDYFGGPYDKKAENKFKDLVKELDPTFIIDDKNLEYRSEPRSIAGKYFMIKGYGFRESAWGYECLITPEDTYDSLWKEVIEGGLPVSLKAKGDRGKNYFTRYKTSNGGKPEFNPVTKTGGFESIEDTKKRIG